jgi:hypothetical protein
MTPRIRSALILSAILTASACGDNTLTSPVAGVGGTSATLASAGPAASNIIYGVRLLKRSKALKATATVEGVIGVDGGTLSIPRAGVAVTFPRGAVTTPTRITLTATKGKDVVYEFEPHGLKFGVPVIVRQDLQQTTAASNPLVAAALQGSYFEGPMAANRIGTHGVYARIKEGRKARLYPATRFLEFSIEHFSGYEVSTGLLSINLSIDVEAR